MSVYSAREDASRAKRLTHNCNYLHLVLSYSLTLKVCSRTRRKNTNVCDINHTLHNLLSNRAQPA